MKTTTTRKVWQWCSEQAEANRRITIRRCASAVGLASTSTVGYHLCKLVGMGYLSMDTPRGPKRHVYRVVVPLLDYGAQKQVQP